MAEKSGGIFNDLNMMQYDDRKTKHIFKSAKDNLSFVQRLELISRWKVHNGCVNTTCWNDRGTLLLSGSDDQHLVLTNPYTGKVLSDVHTAHRANIFCARFLPGTGDQQVVSCSGDGKICCTNLEYDSKNNPPNMFDCHMATTYKVVVVPGDAHSFLSCGEDGTIRWFDLRVKSCCQNDDCQEDVLINCGRATCSLAVNPLLPWQLSAGCADSTIRIFDRRMLSTEASGGGRSTSLHSMLHCFRPSNLENTNRRITSLTYDDSGQSLLASYSSDSVYLFSLKEEEDQEQILKVDSPLNGEHSACGDAVEAASGGGGGESGEAESPTAADGGGSSGKQPALGVHKLRLRGDWSDTGPNARPEGEREQNQELNPTANIMQRMSTMLTRWLENHTREVNQPAASATTSTSNPPSTPSTSTPSAEETVAVKEIVVPPPELVGGPSELESKTQNISQTKCASSKEENIGDKNSSEHHENESKNSSSVTGVDAINRNPDLSDQKESVDDVILLTTEGFELSDVTPSCSYVSAQSTLSFCDKIDESADVYSKVVPLSSATSINIHHYGAGNNSKVDAVDSSGATSSNSYEPCDDLDSKLQSKHQRVSRNNETSGANINSEESSKKKKDLDIEAKHKNVSNVINETSVESKHKGVSNVNNEAFSGVNVSSGLTHIEEICDRSKSLEISSNNSSNYSKTVENAVKISRSDILNHDHDSAENCDDEIVQNKKTAGRFNQNIVNNDNTCDDGEIVNSDVDSGATEVTEQVLSQIGTGARPKNLPKLVVGPCVIAEQSKSGEKEQCMGGDDASKKPIDAKSEKDGCISTSSGQGSSGLSVDKSSKHQAQSERKKCRRTSDSSEGSSDTESHSLMSPTTDEEHHNVSPSQSTAPSALSPNNAARRLQAMFRRHREEKAQHEELERVYKLKLPQPRCVQVYAGHRNARTMIKEAAFWGSDYVACGSDCGHLFIWNRHTAQLVNLLEADRHVVNCVQPHPYEPILATSGIDYDVKLWAPTSRHKTFNERTASMVMERNRVMLDETRDTVTVPASFMLRLIASIHRVERARQGADPEVSE